MVNRKRLDPDTSPVAALASVYGTFGTSGGGRRRS